MVKGILINRRMEEAAALHSLLKMEHADLIAEMQTIENLPTHERLQLARIRRAQQLKVARQKEKEWLKLERMKGNIPSLHNTNGGGPVGAINRHKMKTYAGAVGTVDSAARKHISFENSVVLLEAASRNDMQEVVDLLEAGITPDAANEDGLTALHQCCIDNNVDMLKLLLEYGANVDAQDSDKWTPLHAAATCGHLELVRILVEHDANLLAVNTDGNMPYDLCDDETTLDFIEAEMSKRGVTQELIDETRSATEVQMLNDLMEISRAEGDLEFSDQQGATPLHIAAANGYARVVEFLLEMHVNVDAADHDLWTPVHAAACWGHLEVLEMLAQCGADLNVRNKDNETPSDICEDPEIRERIEQLKTEQESKRLAEAQRRRVRRSQSNNTRAQSVRRTSLRDKTLTTKKDAVEEARLRLQAQEVFTVTANGTATASEVATSLEAKSIDVGTQAKQTTTTTTTTSTSTTFGLSSMSSIYSHLSSSSKLMSSTTADMDNNNQKIIRNHATNVNVNAKAKSNADAILPNNACQNHSESNTNHNNNKNINNNHNSIQQQSKKQQQQQSQLKQSKQQQQQPHDNYSLINNNNNNGFDAGGVGGFNSSKSIQKGYGNGGIDGMQLVKDELDATNNQLYLTGRLNASDMPHVVDDNNKHYFLNNGYKTLNTERSESVQVQSSKEAANGQINVQVTVLVDTTQHALPQQQQQQQQQQEMLNQRLNAENRIYENNNQKPNPNQNQNNQNTNLINQQHQNQTNSMHKNIGNNFNQKILNSNNNANVLLLPLQNAATLANLKKQRSLSRNSVFNSNSEINSVVVVGTTTSGGAAAGGSAVDANNTTNSLTTTTTTNQHNNSNKINNNINNHHNNNNNNNNSNNNNNNNNINSNNNNNNNNINSSSINSNNHYSNSNSNKNDVRTTRDDVDDLNTKNYMLVDTNNTNTSPSTILDFHRVPLKNTINNFSNATSSHLGAGVGANVVKFSGVPGDVVSDSTNSRRCCILM